jgi:hypothetical protein
MKIAIVSHVNDDGDILDAWFQYYLRLGVSSFHLIVHGSSDQNRVLYILKDRYPVVIEESYEGEFDSREKKRRLDSLLARMRGRWILLVDSDEFVEFPYRSAATTARIIELAGKTALYAPMLQHMCREGTLETPPVIEDPFHTQPLCSVELYQRMGVHANIDKYPLFYCTKETVLYDGGNHHCPIGNSVSPIHGVTHHFKFRKVVGQRLGARIESKHPWRHESVGFWNYLESSHGVLPTEGSFLYSRRELFLRGLLRRLSLADGLRRVLGRFRKIQFGEKRLGPPA